jgi:hypothetical protein
MTHSRTRTLAAMLALAFIGVGAVACAKANSDAPAEGAAFATLPPKTAVSTTLPIGADCTVDQLKDASAVQHPNADIENRKCTSTFAIATILPVGGPKAGLAGFYTAAGNVWTFVTAVPANGDVAAGAPPDFPPDLVTQWKDAYVDPTRTTTTTVGSDGSSGGSSGSPSCGLGDGQVPCTTTTTARATTTSTSKSSTPTQSTTTPASPTTTKPVTTTSRGGGLG